MYTYVYVFTSQFEKWATHVKQTWIVTVQPVTMVPHIVKSTILA